MPPGTSENPVAGSGSSATAAPAASSSTPASTASVSSGTASAAMIKAATDAASSAATVTPPAGAGDTSTAAGAGAPGAIPAATGQPQATGQPVVTPPATGQAPDNRIQAAVRNARSETLQRMETHLGFKLNEVDPQELRQGLQLIRRLSTPQGARQFLADLQARVGEAGGTVPTGTQPTAYPEADLVSPDGKHKAWSVDAMQKALDIHGSQVEQRIYEKLGPILDFVGELHQDRTQGAERQQAITMVKETLAHARTLPHFKEHEPAIMAKMKEMGPRVVKTVGPVAALYMAFEAVKVQSVYPKLESTIEARVRDSYSRKAAGSGAAPMAPAGASAQPPQLRNVTDLAKHLERMSEAS